MMQMIIDGNKVYEDTEDAMFNHWDYDAMFESEPEEDEEEMDKGIGDLIDRFIATGDRG